MRNILVISTVEHSEAALGALLAEDDVVKLVVPVVRQGLLDWLANDQAAFTHAEQVADRMAEQLPGSAVEALAGEADVRLAINDALATFPADEIVVAVHPEDEQGVIESKATANTPTRSVSGVPVRVVVVSETANSRPT